MSDFDTITLVGLDTPTYRVYPQTDWRALTNKMRRLRATEGYSWTLLHEATLTKITPGEIRKRLSPYLRSGDELQIAQWPGKRPETPHYPDEISVNEIGIKRIRQKKHSQKNGTPETATPPAWTTYVRLVPYTLTERAQAYQESIKRVRESGRIENERVRNRPAPTDAERWQMELDSVTPWEAKEMELERVRKLRQEWVDMRQNERENGPRLRAEAIRIQKERAAAGSPIKRRNG